MKSLQVVIAGLLCAAAAGARAQSFEHQLFQISQNASVLAGPSRRAFLAPGAQMAAIQGPAGWQKVTGPDGAFTAEMPGASVYQARPGTFGDTGKILMHMYSVDMGDRAFIVMTTTYPANADFSNPQKSLQSVLGGSAKHHTDDGKWISVNWMTHQGLLAVESIGMAKGRIFRTLWVLRGRQVFAIAYVGSDGTARSEDANRFINSLNIR